MARFPKSKTDDVIRAIGAKDLAKTKIKIGNRGCRIAPWHFDPQHRHHDESQGTWKLKQHPKKEKFKDLDGEHWNGNPPPNYAPKKFKDEELDGERMLPEERWRQQKSLPPWVAALSRSERKGSKEATNNDELVTATSRKNAVALPAPSPLSPNKSTNEVAPPKVAPPTVALAGRKRSYSELEDDAKAALKQSQCWEKEAKETKREKATLQKRSLRDVAEKDKEIVAEIGIGCAHPPKNLKRQVQQLAEDTAHTQKVGNTRIVVEQVNGGAKMSCR
jgi:hypothetical protein